MPITAPFNDWLGGVGVPFPICVDLLYLANPERQNVGSVVPKAFRQLKKTRTWLHVTTLMNNQSRDHAAPCLGFFRRELAEQMKEPYVVRLQRNRVDRSDELRIRQHAANFSTLTLKFPSLQKVAESIKAESAILDGEIVALDQNGAVRFEGLRSRSTDFAIVYFAFDLLHLDGIDKTQIPLVKRKAGLKRVLPRRNTGKIRYTDHIVGEGKSFFAELEKMGLEGMVAKRLDSLYVPGRTRAWLKVKTQAGRDEMQKRSEAWH